MLPIPVSAVHNASDSDIIPVNLCRVEFAAHTVLTKSIKKQGVRLTRTVAVRNLSNDDQTPAVHVPNIYIIKRAVRGVSPMIWRRLRISGSSTPAQFHHVIQIAMGWDDDFLHKFRIYGKEYGIHYPGGAFYADDPNDVRIDAFEFEPGDRFIYTYNYFDNLVHDIRVESIVHLNESHWNPDCIGGNQLTYRNSWSPPEGPFDASIPSMISR